jgi:endonuclease-3
VQRLAQRLGWSKHNEPEKIEIDLCAILPRSEWDQTGHVLIFHGRRCCFARKPDCPGCSVNDVCPAAFDAEHVGRKEARRRVPAHPLSQPTSAKKIAPKKIAARKTAPKKIAPKKGAPAKR